VVVVHAEGAGVGTLEILQTVIEDLEPVASPDVFLIFRLVVLQRQDIQAVMLTFGPRLRLR